MCRSPSASAAAIPARAAAGSARASRSRGRGRAAKPASRMPRPLAERRDLEQARAGAAARPRRVGELSSARAAAPRGPASSALAVDDHDVLAGAAQARRRGRARRRRSVPAAVAAPPRLPSSPASAASSATSSASPPPGAWRSDGVGARVERGRARAGDGELDVVAADALADAQVEDRRVVDRVAVEQQHGVGELEVGDVACSAGVGERARDVERQLAAGARGEVAASRARRGTAAASRNASSLVVSPPASAAARGAGLLERARGGVERLLPRRRHQLACPRARAAAMMRSSTWTGW